MLLARKLKQVSVLLLAFVAVCISMPSFVFAQANTNAPRLVLKINELAINDFAVTTGQQLTLTVSAENATDMLAADFRLLIPLTDVSILGIEQKFDFCKVWDKKPEYTNGYLEIICAQGAETKAAGDILVVKLVPNRDFNSSEISIKTATILNQNKQLFTLSEPAKVKLTNVSVAQTPVKAGGTGSTGSNTVQNSNQQSVTNPQANLEEEIDPNTQTLINVVLVGALLISLLLTWRHFRLNRDEEIYISNLDLNSLN